MFKIMKNTIELVQKKQEKAKIIFEANSELEKAKKELSKIDIKSFTKGRTKIIVDSYEFNRGGEKIVEFEIDIKYLAILLQQRVDRANKKLVKLLNEF